MKKILLFLLLIFFAFSGYSQISWDWETEGSSYSLWQWGDALFPDVVENPLKTFYNMSDSVIYGKTGTVAWNWGYGASLTEDIYYTPDSDTLFTIKILADVAAPLNFKFENEGPTASEEYWADYTTPGQWQVITIHLDVPSEPLTKWIFWFDPEHKAGTEIDFWIDDVMQEEPTVMMYNDHDMYHVDWEVFSTTFEVAENPLVDGINKSADVGHTVTGAETWDGMYVYTDGTFDVEKDTVFTMDVYSEFAGSVHFKIEQSANNSVAIERAAEYTTPGEWAKLEFGFPDATMDTYGALVIMFDFGETTEGNDWYFDNIQGPPVVPLEWGYTINLSVVDQVGFSEMGADIWWNPGEERDEGDPNTYLFWMDLTDDDTDGTWEGSIVVPWSNLVTGVIVDHLYCLVGDGEELEDNCDVPFQQIRWENPRNLVDTVFAEASVENIPNSSTMLYPNPVKDVLTISNAGDIQDVHVYSIVGKRLMSITNLSSGEMELNVSRLQRGVYMIHLSRRDGSVTAHKIMVE